MSYGFDVTGDCITGVDAGDMALRSLSGGRDTVVTFEGVETSNTIILHDVKLADLRDIQSELYSWVPDAHRRKAASAVQTMWKSRLASAIG